VGLRQSLLRLQRIVDDDQVGAAAGQLAADRGGHPTALGRRLELRRRLTPQRESGREQGVGTIRWAIARQFVGEVLRVTYAEDLGARLVAEGPVLPE
jgi:hypothetical protein